MRAALTGIADESAPVADGCRSALNQALCEETAALAEGAELAFFPPVTGG